MRRVQFEDVFHFRRRLARCREQLRHLSAHLVGVGGDNRRGVGQTMGQTYLFHPVAKQVFHPLNERLQRFFGFFGGLVYFIRQLVQRLVGFSDRLERFAVELGQVAHHPLVDAIGEQQHFDPFLTQQLEVRAALRRRIAVGCDVVDLLLTFFHA